MQKLTKKVPVEYDFENWDFECLSIEQLKIHLDQLEKLGATHISVLHECSFYINDYMQASYKREETDQEYLDRLNRMQEENKNRMETMRQEYIRLKQIFE